jgi:bla regulator protein BlaR1
MIPMVADHLWQSTLFAIAAGLLTLAFQKHRAAVRFWLWFAASLKFLVPFAAFVALGTALSPWFAPRPSQRDVSIIIQATSQPFSQTLFAAADAGASNSVAMIRLAPLGLVVWAIGFVAVLGAWTLKWRRVTALIRHAVPLESGPELTILRDLERRAGVGSSIRAMSMGGSLEPGIFGVFKPVLVWPRCVSQRLAPEQVESILAHEVCHVRRRDNLLAAIHMFVEAAFWFHPMTWLIGRQLLRERERACDEDVIALGSAPLAYAQSILRTCELCIESPLACAAGVTGSDLKQRIARIVQGDAGRPLGIAKGGFLTVAAAMAVMLPVGVGVMRGPRLLAQIPSADPNDPRFDVVSVKPNRSQSGRMVVQVQPNGRYVAENFTIHQLIRQAYQVQDGQIVGEPTWAGSDRFDILAQATGEAPRGIAAMLRSMLADRFKLTAHVENKDLPLYWLTMARADGKFGPQLLMSHQDCSVLESSSRAAGGTLPPPPPPPPPPKPGERPTCGLFGGLGRFAGGGVTTSQFATSLSVQVRRMVVDHTGLDGRFDLELIWTPDQLPQRAPGTPIDQPIRMNGYDIDPNGPSIFTALQEQLGLKLVAQTGPVPVLVIDHIELPTEN